MALRSLKLTSAVQDGRCSAPAVLPRRLTVFDRLPPLSPSDGPDGFEAAVRRAAWCPAQTVTGAVRGMILDVQGMGLRLL